MWSLIKFVLFQWNVFSSVRSAEHMNLVCVFVRISVSQTVLPNESNPLPPHTPRESTMSCKASSRSISCDVAYLLASPHVSPVGGWVGVYERERARERETAGG